jgi:hypothetical protein
LGFKTFKQFNRFTYTGQSLSNFQRLKTKTVRSFQDFSRTRLWPVVLIKKYLEQLEHLEHLEQTSSR